MNAEIVAVLEVKFPPDPPDSEVFKVMHKILEFCLDHPDDIAWMENIKNRIAEESNLPPQSFEIDGDAEQWIGVNFTTKSGRKISVFSEILTEEDLDDPDE